MHPFTWHQVTDIQIQQRQQDQRQTQSLEDLPGTQATGEPGATDVQAGQEQPRGDQYEA